MKEIILLLLLINFSTNTYNQIIKGIIQDHLTHSPINFAAVYFNATFVGTHSNQNGSFELDISKNKSMPLTISSLGYYSVTVSDIIADKYYRIYLTPKVFELNEVIISAKANTKARRERKVNLKSFKDEFLGTTMNALKCEITNENDLSFKYDSVNDTLKAFSINPILIENMALGYRISYYLDKFESCKKNGYFFYSGNIVFQEDITTKKNQIQRFERRRKNAYLGSRMHFFRTLWENLLDSTGYSVFDTTYKKLNYNNFIIQKDSLTKYLLYSGKLFVSYYKKAPETCITMINDSVYFNKNGYFDALGIKWAGEMAKQRIADCLPYEYSIKQNILKNQ
jgi:hypothetical protein